MMRVCRKQAGFTLMEIMVTMVIAVILATVAIPSFNNMIQRNRIATKTNMLVSFLAVARSEAIKLGKPVTVCSSSNGTACTGGSFEDGWIVFVDTGTAGTVDGTDRVLNVQEKLGGGLNVTFTPPGAGDYIQFAPTGMLTSACDQCVYDIELLATENNGQASGWSDRLLAALLPWGTAHADPHPEGDEEGVEEGVEEGAGIGVPEPIYTYTVCDSQKKAMGQSVRVFGSGRISSRPYTCP